MTVVLGAGISGLSASYHLSKKNIKNIVFEQDSDWGGLCGNFTIDGFRFDKAVHLSFSKSSYVRNLFSNSCEYNIFEPLAYNYYKGFWLRHPVQNHIKELRLYEKLNIIRDFIFKNGKQKDITDYEQWLRVNFGNYLSENFFMPYTRKYWTCEAKDLTIDWIGKRIRKTTLIEVLTGAFSDSKKNFYYTDKMIYPKKGGYKSFLSNIKEKADIRLNKKVIKINTTLKTLYFDDNTMQQYSKLISSIPLPEYLTLIDNIPTKVENSIKKLKYTSVALVSLGFCKKDIPKCLWFYIYDENILPSRGYSPSMKSQDNVPKNCSSLQFETYFSKDRPLLKEKKELVDDIIEKVKLMKMPIDKNDIVVKDYRVLKYANIIFYKDMEADRQIVQEFLEKMGIKTIGRFGKWEYFWSDQSLLSAKGV